MISLRDAFGFIADRALRGSLQWALVISLTPLRALSVIYAPLVLLSVGRSAGPVDLLLLVVFLAGAGLAYLHESQAVTNAALSLFLLTPAIGLFFMRAGLRIPRFEFNAARAWYVAGAVLLLNGLIGYVQYLLNPGDDAAIGIYGRSGLGIHGLAVTYVIAAVAILATWRSRAATGVAIALGTSFLSCTYGMGLVSIAAGLAVATLLTFGIHFRAVVKALALLAIAAGMLNYINPTAIRYNLESGRLVVTAIAGITAQADQSSVVPRKVLAWIGYGRLVADDPELLLFGLGPGTFNSRAAFMLNGDYTSMSALPVSVTPAHERIIRPLWNSEDLTLQFQDGSMNQPFSSVLGLLSEYGLVAFLCFCVAFIRLWGSTAACAMDRRNAFLTHFLFSFVAMIGLLDNILEYPEMIVVLYLAVLSIWQRRVYRLVTVGKVPLRLGSSCSPATND